MTAENKGMNGLISESSRPTRSLFHLGAAASLSFSLLSGFLAGFNLNLGNIKTLEALEQRPLSFQALTWIKPLAEDQIQLGKVSQPEPYLSIKGPEQVLIRRRASEAGPFLSSKAPKTRNLARLRHAFEEVEMSGRDSFTDFQIAAKVHKGAFSQLIQETPKEDTDWVIANEMSTIVPVPRPKTAMFSENKKRQQKDPTSEVAVNFAPSLSVQERAKLTSLLLSEQLATVSPKTRVEPTAPKPFTLAHNDTRAEMNAKYFSEPQPETLSSETLETAGPCGLGINHAFEKPVNDPTGSMSSQLCPERLSWISKSWANKGWVKLEGPHHMPTLAFHPAPSKGATLLLNEYEIASLALKMGVQPTKGMGIIAGRVPDGYKIEFTGRSEETDYFESKNQKYFAILNAEPGAGVIELVSDKSQELNSTVFVPVLEDVVTFLDLKAPEPIDLSIQVVKNGIANDSEVVGLTLGLSTHNGIQAITKSDGSAFLRQVRLVKGYPVFLDLGSRQQQENSYVYRYEIATDGDPQTHTLNQISEKSLYRWLNQVRQGLSDQSAMVVGAYARNRFDGFRDEFRAEVKPLTSKFGLEPLNYSLLWNGEISLDEPLEGDLPRFMAVQVSEGLSQINLNGPGGKILKTDLLPVSPRVIHVVSP